MFAFVFVSVLVTAMSTVFAMRFIFIFFDVYYIKFHLLCVVCAYQVLTNLA